MSAIGRLQFLTSWRPSWGCSQDSAAGFPRVSDLKEKDCVSVCLGCHDKNPPDWEASTIEEAYFSQFWRLEVPVEVSAGVVSPEASVLALQMVSFLLGPHGFCSVYASPYFIPLSIRTPVLLGSSLS